MSGNAARPSADPGWIRLSDVRYALNTVNRKVYLNAPPDGKDPNHEVDPYVVKDDGGNYVSAPDVAEQQFVYRTLGSVWAEGIAPEAYEEVKFNATKATPPESGAYTGGLYCPENTTATSTASLAGGLDLTGTLNSTQAGNSPPGDYPSAGSGEVCPQTDYYRGRNHANPDISRRCRYLLARNDDTCRCGSTCGRHLLYQRE